MTKVNIPIDRTTLGSVSHDNFFISTKATFIECNQPKEEPSYTSEGGSCYWHGTDKEGRFVIREADHWCQYYVHRSREMKRFRARIRSCSWDIKISNSLNETEIIRCGKCYLDEFERIMWKTKRRYESLT
ncbi:MAG: hypothetical protein ACJA01_002473 [Saprospiraceae bacterium]